MLTFTRQEVWFGVSMIASWYFVFQFSVTEKRGAFLVRLSLWHAFADGLGGECQIHATSRNHSAGCPTARSLFSEIESRIGRTTNSAIATTMKFMIAAIANTECQLPV
jgi:hypothetical protein